MGIFDRLRGDSLRVHIIIKGRIGEGWQDVDAHVRVPHGCTLAKLVDVAGAAGVPLREALDGSPHLAETLMLNGERSPLADHGELLLSDGDEVYLLAPIAGGEDRR
jgi:molybdopterin converting factor small subunit